MSIQPSVGGPLQDAIGNPGDFTPTYRTSFTTPEFRTKVIEILSRTANGCLQELGYRPGMTHQIVELQNRVSSFQEENRKLYADNQRLVQMVKESREKHTMAERFYSGTIHSLERQILSLQKENHDVLVRERSLAGGQPEYARLQADYMRLQGFCSQLKLQVMTLQKMLIGNPPPQPPQVAVSNQQNNPQNRVGAGGQPIAGNLSKQPPTQDAPRKQHHQQRPFVDPVHDGRRLVQQPRSQSTPHSQTHPHSPIPNMPGPPTMQNEPGSQSAVGSSAQLFSQANQILLNHKTAAPSVSRPSSSSSRHSNDAMDVDYQGFKLPGYKPVIYGWTGDGTGPTIVTNLPPQINPPRRQASAPSTLSGGNSKVTPSPTTTVPTTAPASMANYLMTGLPHLMGGSPAMGVPFVNHEFGTNVVPIGPPGKFLPPLAASIAKPQSPSTSSSLPSPVRAHLASTRMPMPLASAVDLAPPSPVKPPIPTAASTSYSQNQISAPVEVNENLRTPHLTPTSSRSSVALSEDILETITPLDTPISPTFGMTESPAAIHMEGAGGGFGGETASSLKRGSMHIAGGIDEGNKLGADGMRKKPRLSEVQENFPKPGDSAAVVEPVDEAGGISTNTSETIATAEAVGERNDEDEDVEEEEEIGPDGARSVKYCLEAFTDDDDDGLPTCLLCLSRFRSGLIEAPARFPPDMPQEEKVQHFLDEHPTSWEDFRFARNG